MSGGIRLLAFRSDLSKCNNIPLKKSDTSTFERESKPGVNAKTKHTENVQLKIIQKTCHEKVISVLTTIRAETDELKPCEISKKRKRKDTKTDKKILTKKGKKEQEYLVQAEESQSSEENMKNNNGFRKLVKSEEHPETDEPRLNSENLHSEETKTNKSNSEYKYDEASGIWVQCNNKVCRKWRYLADVEDPIKVPRIWDCTMNSDQEYNSCDAPQVTYDESELIYTDYTIGSIVWAKISGYPWWPAMVDLDPDTDTYFEVLEKSRMVPIQFHVTFFGNPVTRSWLKTRFLIPYDGELPEAVILEASNPFKKVIKTTMRDANKALQLSLKARVEKFGFLKRFTSSRLKEPVTKKKHAKQYNPIDDSSKTESPKFVVDELFDVFEDYEYLPVTTASRRKPLSEVGMKEQLDQGEADTTNKIKSKSDFEIAKTDTGKDYEINLLDKSFKNDSYNCVDNINLGDCDEKKNDLMFSIKMIPNQISKQMIKKTKCKSLGENDCDLNGNMNNRKDNGNRAKHIVACVNDDNLILCASKNACNDDSKEILAESDKKTKSDYKPPKKSKIEIISKKQKVIDYKNETNCLTNDVSTYKKKSGKNKRQKHNKEVSEIAECLMSTTNIPEKVKKSRKRSMIEKTFDGDKNEKKLNLCKTRNDNSSEIKQSHFNRVQSSKLESVPKHLMKESLEEIQLQTGGKFAEVNEMKKSESSCENKMKETGNNFEKEKHYLNSKISHLDTERNECINGPSGRGNIFKEKELLNKQNVIEETHKFDIIENEVAVSCTKELSHDNKEKFGEKVKHKSCTGTKRKDIGNKQMEKNNDQIRSRLKLFKGKCITKMGNENAKEVQVNSTDQNVTIKKTLDLSDRKPSTNHSKKNTKVCFKIKSNSEVEADQQLVPDIETGAYDNSDICSDLPFSDLTIMKEIKEPTSNFDKTITIHNETSGEGRYLDWDIQPIKLDESSAKKNRNYEDSCHEGSDDFILHLDTDDDKEDVMGEENHDESLVFDQFSESDFCKFDDGSVIDLTE